MTFDVKKCRELESESNMRPYDLESNERLGDFLRNNAVTVCDELEQLRKRLEAAERVVSSAEKYMAYVVGMDVHSYRGEDGDCDYCDVEDPLKEALVDYEAAVKS